jgi:hypothetical protein
LNEHQRYTRSDQAQSFNPHLVHNNQFTEKKLFPQEASRQNVINQIPTNKAHDKRFNPHSQHKAVDYLSSDDSDTLESHDRVNRIAAQV